MKLEIVRRTRKNHALEHATIAVLMERGARPPLAGYSTPGGFFVYGSVSREEVTSAASEALGRLRAGHRELAISPYCGTNLVAGALLAGLLTGIAVRSSRSKLRRVPVVAAALVGSTFLGRPLGTLVQRHYTTLPDLRGAEITGVGSFRLGGHTFHRVRVSHPAE